MIERMNEMVSIEPSLMKMIRTRRLHPNVIARD